MVEVEDRDTFAACLLMPWSSMKPFGKLKLQKFIDLDVFRSFSGLFNVLKVLVWRRWALAFLGSSRWGNFLGSFPNRQDQEEDPACGDPSCELIQSSSVCQVWRFWCVCQAFEYCTLSFERFFLAGYLPSEGEMLSFQTTMTTMEDGLGGLILVYISRTICLYSIYTFLRQQDDSPTAAVSSIWGRQISQGFPRKWRTRCNSEGICKKSQGSLFDISDCWLFWLNNI